MKYLKKYELFMGGDSTPLYKPLPTDQERYYEWQSNTIKKQLNRIENILKNCKIEETKVVKTWVDGNGNEIKIENKRSGDFVYQLYNENNEIFAVMWFENGKLLRCESLCDSIQFNKDIKWFVLNYKTI